MLIRFGVSNYLSTRDYQELSLVASSLKDQSGGLIDATALREKLLPSILVYGPNASGKTNVLLALSFMRSTVRNSHKAADPTGGVPRHPFLLDEDFSRTPTQLDCDFIVDNVRYHFGFATNDEEFLEEWVYAFPNGNRQTWYYRKKGESIYFGKHLRGKNKSIASLTRPNSLFLSAAAQNAHDQLLPVYQFFQDGLMDRVTPALNITSLERDLSKSKIDDKILAFLRLADTGIQSSRMEELAASDDAKRVIGKLHSLFLEEFPDNERLKDLDLTKRNRLSFGHAAGEGKEVFINMRMESRGTLRLIKLLRPIFRALESGSVLLVDEIETSVHPFIAARIVSMFNSKETNKLGAQLIAATHDTNLLRSEGLRRDQIWFTEKDQRGATHLYPLTDIKIRNTDNLEKGYLQGRFGAVPFMGPIEDLLRESQY